MSDYSDYDQMLRQFTVAQFLGAYSFWMVLEKGLDLSEEARQGGLAVLRALGWSAYGAAGGRARTQAEADAYRYCGIGPETLARKGQPR